MTQRHKRAFVNQPGLGTHTDRSVTDEQLVRNPSYSGSTDGGRLSGKCR